MIEFILDLPLDKTINHLSELFVNKPVNCIDLVEENYEFIAWGDPINKQGFQLKLKENSNVEFIMNNLFGHYYYIHLNKAAGNIYIGNSLFSILPFYYCQVNSKIVFSNNALDLGKYIGKLDISGRFILETVLFNYPLFNSSAIDGISLLPSNSYISVSGNDWSIVKHTFVEDLFTKNPTKWSDSVDFISDLFLETVQKYLPDQPYACSLTGGFDGRTLVSSGLYYRKDFSSYCFGSLMSKDIQIAGQISGIAKIPFIGIDLNEEYVNKSSLSCGKEFILNASGTASFARAHYLHAARELYKQNKYIITGNFGSEVFRAAHVAGVVFSPNLYTLFNSRNIEEGIAAIEDCMEFNYLSRETYTNSWEALKNDLYQLPCYNPDYSNISKNQQFYVFVFEEVFRKYFGAEMVNQFRYVKNRTPFLDIDFLKAIFTTGLAGVYSDFFEHNPLKRYKGQVLYAHIIKKAYPDFGKVLTDKGYRPDDLLSFSGKLNILKGYVNKKASKITSESDPNCVAKAWEKNRYYWQEFPISSEYFDSVKIKKNEKVINKELLFRIISLSYLMKEKLSNQ